MPHLPQHVRDDLDYILLAVTQLPNVLDELALLRVAIRAYQEGRSAEEAVAWAAQQISNSLTSYP